jgi:hypothetical protein
LPDGKVTERRGLLLWANDMTLSFTISTLQRVDRLEHLDKQGVRHVVCLLRTQPDSTIWDTSATKRSVALALKTGEAAPVICRISVGWSWHFVALTSSAL